MWPRCVWRIRAYCFLPALLPPPAPPLTGAPLLHRLLIAWVCSLLAASSAHAASRDAGDVAPLPPPLPPPVPLVFVTGPHWTMEAGVRSMGSLRTVVFGYDAVWSANIGLDESRPLGKTAGILGRGTKLLFLDAPLVFLEGVLVHEAFGHGARVREMGLRARYNFAPPFPYGIRLAGHDESQRAGSASWPGVTAPDRSAANGAAGMESSTVGAWWINTNAVRRDGWLHYSDLLAYVMYKMDYSGGFGPPLDDYDFDGTTYTFYSATDPIDYVTDLHSFALESATVGREDIIANLRRARVGNFVDPTLLLGVLPALWTYGIQGRPDFRLPMLRIGDVAFFPGTRLVLSPFGAEHYVDVFAHRGGVTADVYGRVGSSGLASYWGAGARVFDIDVGHGVALGGAVDAWRQPELHFGDNRPKHRKDRFGAGVAVEVDWRLHPSLGWVTKVGTKTKGFAVGLPLDASVYGYTGLSIARRSRAGGDAR
jgi:hypothetical protein